MKTILICTVGGSHQPILKSIQESKPDYVCFICTGPDPETGQAGSERQIEGKGNVISMNRGEPPSLPNIPQQVGLGKEQFTLCRVPADDLDQAFSIISAELNRLGQTYEEARFIADYTGGTKTMTAALVTAALETSNVKLQLVTGARANLVKVTSDSEYAISANVDGIRLKRSMQPFLDAWARYAYDEAASGLCDLPTPQNAELRASLNRARGLSRAFVAWDRFDHQRAGEILQPYRAVIGKKLGLHLKTLSILNEEDGKRRESLQLYDLWLNAHRRAAQGRYDDAVACSDKGITVTFLNRAGRVRARFLGNASRRSGLPQRMLDLLSQPDWQPRYLQWQSAMEQSAANHTSTHRSSTCKIVLSEFTG